MILNPSTRAAAFALIAAYLVCGRAMAQEPPTDEQLAAADLNSLPLSDAEKKYIFYLTTRPYVGEQSQNLRRAIKLVVASNSRQQILERCVPVEVLDTDLLRINLADLGWRLEDWHLVAGKRNPYCDTNGAGLVTRADYLLVAMSDQQESDGYLRLMFGGNNLPKTIEAVRKFFRVDNNPDLRFGMIEGKSGVNKQGTRWVENRPISRGYYWFTEDALKIDLDRDPVEHPDGSFKHDGEEHIFGLPKFSTRLGQTGTLQWYCLANGKGEIVARAPVDLVEDDSGAPGQPVGFRGFREIRNPGSCIQCHTDGLNPFTRNEFRELRKDGVPFYAPEEQAEQLEAFHLRDLKPEFDRNVLDYKMACTLSVGCTSSEASKSFQAAINAYDAPVNLAKAARELGCTVEKLSETLNNNQPLPNRLDWLTKGNELQPDGETRSKAGEIYRASFEQYFRPLSHAVHFGKPLNKPPEPVAEVVEPKPVRQQRGRR